MIVGKHFTLCLNETELSNFCYVIGLTSITLYKELSIESIFANMVEEN